ncbi:MAG: S16 family serine protease [Bacillota bacterium]
MRRLERGIAGGAPRRRALALAVFALVLCAGFLPSGFVAVSPGPVFSLTEMVEVSGRRDPATPFHMVTVAAEEANWYRALSAAVDPRVSLWDKKELTGGKSLQQYQEEMERLMEETRIIAAKLAFKHAGMPDTDEALSLVSIENGEVLGPSGSLAFALQLSSILRDEDLAGGAAVAATGVLDESGKVSAVGGISHKAASCRDGGIDLFIVPKANLEEAVSVAEDLCVIGVESLDEAIQAVREATRSIP